MTKYFFLMLVLLIYIKGYSQINIKIINVSANLNNANVTIDYQIINSSSKPIFVSVPIETFLNSDTDSGIYLIYNKLKTEIVSKLLLSENAKTLVINPKEVVYKKIILSKYFIMNYLKSKNLSFGNDISYQLFIYEYKNRLGGGRKKIESNIFLNKLNFWSFVDDSIINRLNNLSFITELYIFPSFNQFETNTYFNESKLIENGNFVGQNFPKSSLSDWSNYIIYKKNYTSLYDSIQNDGFNKLNNLHEITKDNDLKIKIEKLIELVQNNEYGKILYDIDESPYYNDIIYIQSNNNFEKEFELNNSKYIKLANYILKNMSNLLITEWANYILALKDYMSKDDLKKKLGTKLLKELNENTNDERLHLRINNLLSLQK